MRSLFATLRQLVLPAGAGANQGRVVLGPDVPSELTTYYAALPYNATIHAAILFYDNAGGYTYYAALTNPLPLVTHAIGQVQTGVVTEVMYMTNPVGGGQATNFLGGLNPSTTTPQIVRMLSPVDLRMDAESLGRGLRSFQSDVTGTAALAAETAFMNASATWLNGRCYRHTIRMFLRPGGAVTQANLRIRRINIAGGAYIANMIVPFTAAAGDIMVTFVAYHRNTTGADITQNLMLTLTPNGGTIQVLAGASFVASWEIEDCGASVSFPNVNTLV